MAQDCPLCFSKGVFCQWTNLKDSLVSLSTRSFICPLCCGVHEGLDKFTLHLVSHEMEAKKSGQDLPTISIKEQGSNPVDSLDELLADFSEFVRKEDKLSYDNQVELRTKAPNPLKMSPKNKSPLGAGLSSYPSTIQTPLPLPHTMKANLNNNLLLAPIQLPQKPVMMLPAAAPMTPAAAVATAEPPDSPSSQLMQSPGQCSNKQAGNNSGEEPKSPPSQVQCSLCGWNFDNDEFLKVHMVLMHSKRNQAILQRRLKRVVDEYKCRECEGTFSAYEEFVSHLRQVHNDHRFVCHICAKIFKLKGSLLVHLRVVHDPLGEGAHHCKVCNRKFTNKHRRDVHERKHTDARQFECGKCGMSFEEKGEFEIHMETHKTEHKCNICSRSFYTQAALFVHSMGHQNNTSSPMEPSTIKIQDCVVKEEPAKIVDNKTVVDKNLGGIKCQVCEKVFKRESHLNQHMKVHDNKQWECDVCRKTFTTKYFLKKHKRLHTGETPYACNICGKSFTFQQSYHKHMLYHTDDKPYSCSQCGRAFKELSTLQNHERIHSGERPFACETCGKSFRQRVSYLVHRRIHTGVMPYVCNECGKSFRYKVTQRTHKCLGKADESFPHPKPLTNPLAEENASIQASLSHLESLPMIDLPQQIKDDLMSFRKSQGRKYLQGRLQGYLQKSRERSLHQSEVPSPINQLEHLSLSDNLNQSQSMPNIESLLFEPAKAEDGIKTESVDDFDLQAFL